MAQRKRTKTMNEVKIARSLGWFSIGLGLVEVLATRQLSAFLGTRNTGLVRAFGVRELAAGVAILAQDQPGPTQLWTRVGGDAMDIAALVMTYQNNAFTRKAVGFSLANVLAITALDIWCAQQLKS